jgi:hypothetical protein
MGRQFPIGYLFSRLTRTDTPRPRFRRKGLSGSADWEKDIFFTGPCASIHPQQRGGMLGSIGQPVRLREFKHMDEAARS